MSCRKQNVNVKELVMQILLIKRKVQFTSWWVVALCVLLSASAFSAAGTATNRFVRKDSPSPGLPYNTWDSAATNIQDAVDAAVAANIDAVIVAPGTYDTGGMMAPGHSLTSRVMVNKAIVVRSRDNDPETTIIEGAWDPVTTNGPAAVRGAYLATGAKLIGFTVRKGATGTNGNVNIWGGGVYCTGTGSIISNSVIVGNVAHAYAGGVYSGMIFDSQIVSNRSVGSYGGGARGSIMNGCTISYNQAVHGGGGGSSVTATNCTFAYNVAQSGGAVREGTLYNCLFYGNLTDGPFSGQGGGALCSPLNLYNCTVVGNDNKGSSTGIGGGGIYVRNSQTVVMVNCIVYFNQATQGPNIYTHSGGTLYITNTCTYPEIPGWAVGNITNAPLLIASGSGYGLAHLAGDYHLSRSSPCIDAGLNQAWMTSADDLDGVERIINNLVDIGCYESFYPRGTVILVR